MTAKSPSMTTAQPILSQREHLFRIYNYYRIVVALMLTALLFIDLGNVDIKYRILETYQIGVVSYLGLNIFLGLLMLAGFHPQPRHITLSVVIDILVLHFLLLVSVGITSGLANLLIISVAAGNILTPGRIGLLYAALAGIASLGISIWSVLALMGDSDDIVRAGSLGILYFAAAFLLQNITRRMVRSEELASERARSLVQLEQINQQIIRRMRTGIVVTDRFATVKLVNAAAHELMFGEQIHDAPMSALPTPLKTRLAQWHADPAHRTEPFRASSVMPELQANFTKLKQSQDRDDLTLIFLDDISKITQQAQQMKLASLGRLTAGIAHEIRNPLGAISHAAQLLGESPAIELQDIKMVDMIQRHSVRVNNIIENVLDLSRRRQANVEVTDVGQWLTGFVTDYRGNIIEQADHSEPDIQLYLANDAPPARFDRSQLEQVLVNLCDNGLRYSETHTGKAILAISVAVTGDGERCYVDIADNGPGINAEQYQHIFEPFFTTDNGGTGLGLYLARELCEANQAQLSLLESAGEGCCFRITFAHHGRLI